MRRALLAPVLAAGLLLAGCTPTVALTPAPQATSPRCASVVVGLPETIGGAARRETDAQGTAAWGTPAAVTLTCGVRVPEVSTDLCYPLDGVDWLSADVRGADGRTQRVLTVYGRTPATQLVLPADSTVSAHDALTALSEPIRDATRPNGRRCISVTDAPAATATATAIPTAS